MATSATPSVRDRARSVAETTKASATRHPVVYIGVAMILAQLTLRGWAISHAWFQQDDFSFMQRALESDLTADFLLTPHVGHFMPAGHLLSWINANISPLDWALPAVELLIMQAIASVGALRLLIHMFGARLGILPPLAVFLFSAISMPAFTWWAAGVNQIPILISLMFGLHCHVTYLRDRSFRHAIYTVLWIVFGLLFCEKTLVTLVVYLLVTFCYFARGHIVERTGYVWRTYRPAVLLYAGVVVVYVPFYFLTSINFDAATVDDNPLGPIAQKMGAVAFATGIVGGPVRWISTNVFAGIADPSDITVVASWLVIASVVVAATRTRRNSKRAWLIVATVLVCDILLVATGRAFIVGAVIGLEYRYQTEVVAAAALSLALAFMPVLGAVEGAEKTTDHAVIDSVWTTTALTGVFCAFAVYSSVGFAGFEHRPQSPERYYDNFDATLETFDDAVPMADRAVPERIWSAFAFPSNLYSRMFMMYGDRLDFPDSSADELYMLDDVGHISPVVLDVAQRNEPGPRRQCGYRIGVEPVEVPLQGPVWGDGWWLRWAYLATKGGPVSVTVGDRTYDTTVQPGYHSAFLKVPATFDAADAFDSIEISGLSGGGQICTNDITIGTPQPFVEAAP